MKMNIMVIDDSKIDLFVSQKIIEIANAECEVKIFSSSNSAISFLKDINSKPVNKALFIPDAIFLDINMPEMDGFQFLKEFNNLHKLSSLSIKIYMLSSSTNPYDIKKAESAKCCAGFISKPLAVTDIERVMLEFKPYLRMFDSQAEDINL